MVVLGLFCLVTKVPSFCVIVNPRTFFIFPVGSKVWNQVYPKYSYVSKHQLKNVNENKPKTFCEEILHPSDFCRLLLHIFYNAPNYGAHKSSDWKVGDTWPAEVCWTRKCCVHEPTNTLKLMHSADCSAAHLYPSVYTRFVL